MTNSDRVTFTCDGVAREVRIEPGASLLDVLRDDLGIRSVKDGCAPQGQCGCCTVLIDGDARVACVTPATRVEGRTVTTLEGLDSPLRERLAEAFVATGGSQCGFCTPGIVVRAAAVLAKGRDLTAEADRALTAHLCRCTGWATIRDAFAEAASDREIAPRDLAAASRRASLEGGADQHVAAAVPLGEGGFADDGAPPDALVAVPLPPGSSADAVDAEGLNWVVGDTLLDARTRAGKVQGRRTTLEPRTPLEVPPRPDGGVCLATSWVEPAYLEPDASWCAPASEPATPLANGGAFGGKVTSPASGAARALADELGRPVRVVFSREDVVRLGPKRPPIAASAVLDGARLRIEGVVVGDARPGPSGPLPYALEMDEAWTGTRVPGPATSDRLRAWPLAERMVLVEGALDEAGADRASLVREDRVGAVLLDTCAVDPAEEGAAGARVTVDAATSRVKGVEVRVAAGDPLDDVTLRSYCVGAAHMGLGWVLSEGLTVDPETGEVLDLTIRSFGILRAKDMPAVEVTIVDDAGAPRARASDAVFAAVAAAAWNAVTAATGTRPATFPVSSDRRSETS